jgi:hypothetical protein
VVVRRFGVMKSEITFPLTGMPLVFSLHACLAACIGGSYAGTSETEAQIFFVDERALNRAKKALKVKTDAEIIRVSVERIAEMEEFCKFMKKTRRTLKPGNVERS